MSFCCGNGAVGWSVEKFTRTHEWVKVENGIGQVGITKHAADALGEIVFVDLPAVGKSIKSGAAFGAVESVKAASDLYSPVSGEVVGVNEQLSSSPDLINDKPLDAWIMKVKISNTAEVDALLDEAAYKAFLASEEH